MYYILYLYGMNNRKCREKISIIEAEKAKNRLDMAQHFEDNIFKKQLSH